MNTITPSLYSISKQKERERDRERIRDKPIDIDSICSELSKCSNNRELFNAVMNDLKEEILGEDSITNINQHPQIEIKSFKEFILYHNNRVNAYSSNTNNDNMKSNSLSSQIMPTTNEYYTYKFVSSVPEGEMVNRKPLKNQIMHKNYTDVHANSKYYYSNQFQEGNGLSTDSQWINKTNNIMMNSQSNNWLDLRNTNTNNNSNINMLNNQLQYDNFTDVKQRFSPI